MEVCEYLWQNNAVMCRQVRDILQTQWRMIGACLKPLCKRSVADEAQIDHRLFADQSQIGRHKVAKSPYPFLDKTDHRRVGNQSAMKIKPLQDLKETNETWATKSFTASLLCMLEKLLTTNLVLRPFGDLVLTSLKPFSDLWNFFTIANCFWSWRGHVVCVTRV